MLISILERRSKRGTVAEVLSHGTGPLPADGTGARKVVYFKRVDGVHRHVTALFDSEGCEYYSQSEDLDERSFAFTPTPIERRVAKRLLALSEVRASTPRLTVLDLSAVCSRSVPQWTSDGRTWFNYLF
jgi:hypothetical protein